VRIRRDAIVIGETLRLGRADRARLTERWQGR